MSYLYLTAPVEEWLIVIICGIGTIGGKVSIDIKENNSFVVRSYVITKFR